MLPVLVLTALERTLPALAVVVAVPSEVAPAVVGEIETALAGAGVDHALAQPDAAETARLWSALAGPGEAPRLIEATLWPAAAVDTAALERAVATLAPAAAVDLRPVATPAPTVVVAGAVGLAALALAARRRLRGEVRRLLDAEASTLTLAHRFGAGESWLRANVAAPIERRAGRGAAMGAVVGAAAGTAAVVLHAPALFQPWSGVATVVGLAGALGAGLTAVGLGRLVAAATAERLAALAKAWA